MKLILILSMALTAACGHYSQETIEVYSAGSLRDMMHHGDLSAKAALDTLAIAGNYGLGALDSLGGELWMEDGQIWISEVVNGSPRVFQDPGEMAALMVYSKIDDWQSFEVIGNIEDFITQKARQMGLRGPFPFMLTGTFPTINYHIVQFDMDKDDPQLHQQNAYHGDLSGKDVTILGFYSDQHQGVFTHYESNFHMHVRDNSFSEMGHLEEIKTGNHTFTLMLPVP